MLVKFFDSVHKLLIFFALQASRPSGRHRSMKRQATFLIAWSSKKPLFLI
jgi:hypothetical protein